MKQKQAKMIVKVLKTFNSIISFPFQIIAVLGFLLMSPFYTLDNWLEEKLLWILQGESTDFNERHHKYLSEKNKGKGGK